MDSRSFIEQLQGSKPIILKIYIIGNLLRRRCLKWDRMTHLGSWNINYGQKKGWESNCQFDSRPLKVGNHLDFLTFRLHAASHWKALNEGYNFALNLNSIKGLHTKLLDSKVEGVPILGISGFSLESHRTKWHMDADPVVRHKEYYRGMVLVSPKFGLWWVLWICVCPLFIHALKLL
jgi:hypothetical protein